MIFSCASWPFEYLLWRNDCTDSLPMIYVRVLQRNRTSRVYIRRFIMRNWLMQLWSLRHPTVCPLQVGDPGKPVVWFSLSRKTWEAGDLVVWVAVQGEDQWVSSSSPAVRAGSPPLPFAQFRPTVGEMMPTHIGEGSLLSVPIQNAHFIQKHPRRLPRNLA